MEKSPKVVTEILKTRDYSFFKFDRNRAVIPSHVKKLAMDMKENGWLAGSVVITDEKGNLRDGQHRVLGAEMANVEVHYAMYKKMSVDTTRMLNTKKKNWNIIDHLGFYVKEGNQNYVLLDRFMKNFPTLRPTECTMLVKNSTSSAERGEFESGNFVVRDMKLAYEWGHSIMKLKPYFEKGYNKSIFVRAMVRVLQKPNFDFNEFLHKIELRPRSIYMCGTVEQYLEMIEDIYNYKRKNEEKVNFRF